MLPSTTCARCPSCWQEGRPRQLHVADRQFGVAAEHRHLAQAPGGGEFGHAHVERHSA
jgi:hypothetical protein